MARTVALASGGVLYAVLDGHPFVFPQAEIGTTRRVALDGGRSVELETLSAKPRVLYADGVLDPSECDAIRRLAEPWLEADVTLLTGDRVDAAFQSASDRNSKSALLETPPLSGGLSSDEEVLRMVRSRVASLLRQQPLVAERMQVVRYRPGEHYHYHVDTTGDPATARYATALIYLDDGFTGGETNFPLTEATRRAAPLWQRMLPLTRNGKFVRQDYNNCQTDVGLTVTPKQGRVAIFYNTLPSSLEVDFHSWHGGCDVTRGEKWLANLWFRFPNAQAEARHRQASEHLAAGDHGAAESALRVVLQLQPSNVQAHTDLGRSLFARERVDEAMDSFEAAATHGALQPQDTYHAAYARTNFGRLAVGIAQGHRTVAESGGQLPAVKSTAAWSRGLLQRAVAVSPIDATAYAALGHAWWLEGQLDQARAAMEHATALAPRDPSMQHEAGLLYTAMGEDDTARTHLMQAALLAPSHQPFFDAYSEFAAHYTPVLLTTDAAKPVESVPPEPEGSPAAPPIAIGLVSMTKQPLELVTWLEYHRTVVGVSRFYLRVEDTPELATLFDSPPWDTLVHATYHAATQRDYFGQNDRQNMHVNATLTRARADGLTHLLHIDDDELLYCPGGTARLHEALAAAPADRPEVHLRNLEALFPSRSCASPFREASAFRHEPRTYHSYVSGKSIARLDDPAVVAHGPHHFRIKSGEVGGRGSPISHALPPDAAVVLHYESATFDKWLTKYVDLARQHGADAAVMTQIGESTFYGRSIIAARAVVDARAAKDAMAEAKADKAARELWDECKLAPSGLRKAGARPQRVEGRGLTLIAPFAGYRAKP